MAERKTTADRQAARAARDRDLLAAAAASDVADAAAFKALKAAVRKGRRVWWTHGDRLRTGVVLSVGGWNWDSASIFVESHHGRQYRIRPYNILPSLARRTEGSHA